MFLIDRRSLGIAFCFLAEMLFDTGASFAHAPAKLTAKTQETSKPESVA
jgi:hypothetical protein